MTDSIPFDAPLPNKLDMLELTMEASPKIGAPFVAEVSLEVFLREAFSYAILEVVSVYR